MKRVKETIEFNVLVLPNNVFFFSLDDDKISTCKSAPSFNNKHFLCRECCSASTSIGDIFE